MTEAVFLEADLIEAMAIGDIKKGIPVPFRSSSTLNESDREWARELLGVDSAQSIVFDIFDEKDEFDLVLVDPGPQKIEVIKVLRGLAGLDLLGAKLLVDAAPRRVMERISETQAREAQAALRRAGAIVEVK